MKVEKWLKKNYIDLSKKTVVVTGANSGIGLETCFHLASFNASIIMACRNEGKAKEAKNKILAQYPSVNIEIIKYDQSSFASITSFVEKIKDIKIDGLILNAGVYFPKADYKTEDGYELTFGTNYLGVYYLLKQLKEKLENDSTRVVMVTSLTAFLSSSKRKITSYKKLSRNKAYGFSKLCLSRLFVALSASSINATYRLVHPGITATNILNSEKTGFPSWFSKLGHSFLYLFVHKASKAALCSLLGLIDQEEYKKYISPRGPFAISGFPKKKRIPKKYFYPDVEKETSLIIKEREHESVSE
ncbi:MAG: SDR family NAD(P)-dependent oxidoreductase [Bacilli bacterium]